METRTTEFCPIDENSIHVDEQKQFKIALRRILSDVCTIGNTITDISI